MQDLLVVYNTFGFKNNIEHYKECLNSIFNSDLPPKTRVIISSCMNSKECRDELQREYGDKLLHSYVDEGLPVNITFNLAVDRAVRLEGEFKYYLYVDSGVDFKGNEGAILEATKVMDSDKYGILSFQASNDHALYNVGIHNPPLKGRNHEVPVGTACNGHSEMFSNAVRKRFRALIPDVFVAFCTESTFSFIAAAIGKRWVILGDYLLNHRKGVDGASSSVPHSSPKFGNTWNNLMFGRDANQFIQDKEAYKVGLGYEECNNIMNHDPNAYDSNGLPIDQKALASKVEKYFYLTPSEFNYSSK